MENQTASRSTNRLWGRFPRQRMTGEMLRDSLVFLSQQIDWETGGPGVMPPLPKELESALLKGQWKTSPREQEHYRRSIYLFARRNLRLPSSKRLIARCHHQLSHTIPIDHGPPSSELDAQRIHSQDCRSNRSSVEPQ